MRQRRGMRRLAGVLLVAALASAAACGDDDEAGGDAGGSATTAASAESAFAESEANVAERLQSPTTVGVDVPLSEAPPSDVTLAWLECPIPDCAAFGRGIEAASDLLGWDFNRVPYDLTPEGAQAAFDQALELDPQVIMTVGTDPSWLEEQRAEAASADIVFIDCCTVYEPDPDSATGQFRVAENPPDAVINNVDFIQFEATTLADYAITETDGEVNGLSIFVPDFPIGRITADAIERRLEEVCPDTCTVVPLEVALTDLGTNVGPRVVSELQRDPSINFLFFITGDFATGVTASIVEAGLGDSVTMVGNSGNTTNFQEMLDGEVEQAWLGVPLEVEGWRMVDMAIRTMQGETIPETSEPGDTGIGAWPPFQIVTAENYPEPDPYDLPADAEDQFRALWLVD